MWAIQRKPTMISIHSRFLANAAALTALAAPQAFGAPTVAPIPAAPAFGQAVQLQLRDSLGPVYVPATRYSRDRNTLTVEFEYASTYVAPTRPDFDLVPVDFGELAPGDYLVEARLYDLARPTAAPQVVSSGLTVAPPQDWGMFTVPQQPQAREPTQVLVNSAAFLDPTTMRAFMSGNVIRIDFDYYSHSPTIWGNPPPGAVSLASIAIGGLAPGSYRLEGWGRAKDTGVSGKYFERDLVVAPTAWVIEFYSPSKDHYFISASPEEIARLDSGAEPGWKRTGQRFKAWLRAEGAPVGVMPVCRFYAAGPSSHFYSANPADCDWLRQLEQMQRMQAQAAGQPFLGWGYEGTAFYSLPPQYGVCPGGMTSVYRAYNKGGLHNDSNHRFTADARQRAAMLVSWADEGAAFCSP
jgi:hypothetical protein